MILVPAKKDSNSMTHHYLGPVFSSPCSDMLTALALSVILFFTAEVPVVGGNL